MQRVAQELFARAQFPTNLHRHTSECTSAPMSFMKLHHLIAPLYRCDTSRLCNCRQCTLRQSNADREIWIVIFSRSPEQF